jgi:Asp-tRNA(Asn)/Glu-tRNA(Gln) amidotransferase A subunit family amidase
VDGDEPVRVLAARIRGRELSPVEVVEAALARIDRIDPTVHSFITICPDQALAAARAAEQAVMRGHPLGPLHGVPISVKDCVATAGIRTTFGSLLFEDHVPDADSESVTRLVGAGAIVVGKTNLPEFCSWGRSVNRLGPETVNPWDPTRTAGASSGGAAASVASRQLPIALASDGGGSVRLPAALNGVFGLFPTPGCVPGRGAMVLNGPRESQGPITMDVRDAALLLEVMATPPRVDFTSTIDDGVRALRAAWVPVHAGEPPMESDVVDALRDAALVLAELGAIVEEPPVSLVDSWNEGTARSVAPVDDSYGVAIRDLPGLRAALEDPARRALLSPYIDPDQVLGRTVAAASEESLVVARDVRAQLLELLDRYDVVLTPTIDQIAPVLPGDWGYPYGPAGSTLSESRRAYTKYTLRVNASGCAAASIPAGFVAGMPVGLQVVGRPGAEATILRVARAFEMARPWRDVAPQSST